MKTRNIISLALLISLSACNLEKKRQTVKETAPYTPIGNPLAIPEKPIIRSTIFTAPEFIAIEDKLRDFGCDVGPVQGIIDCPQSKDVAELDSTLALLNQALDSLLKDHEVKYETNLRKIAVDSGLAQIKAQETGPVAKSLEADFVNLRTQSFLNRNITNDIDFHFNFAQDLMAFSLMRDLSQLPELPQLLSDLQIEEIKFSNKTEIEVVLKTRNLKVDFNETGENIIQYLVNRRAEKPEVIEKSAIQKKRDEVFTNRNLYTEDTLDEGQETKGYDLLIEISKSERFQAEIRRLNISNLIIGLDVKVQKVRTERNLTLDANKSPIENLEAISQLQ